MTEREAKVFEFLKNTGISTDEIIDNDILVFEKLTVD